MGKKAIFMGHMESSVLGVKNLIQQVANAAEQDLTALDANKQDKLTPDSTITLDGGAIGVALPVKVLSNEEYDALSDVEKSADILYAVKDGNADIPVNYYSNLNLLDNWYFAGAVNQRGQNEYSNNYQYAIDRWIINDIKYTVGTHSITSKNSSGAQKLYQIIEAGKIPVNETVTFSAIVDGNLYTVTGDALETRTTATPFGSLIMWAENNNGRILELRFSKIAQGNDAIVTATKLELGNQQTLAHKEGGTWVLNDPPPNKALELEKCQRFYVGGVIDMFGADAAEGTSNPNFLVGNFNFPVEMRSIPTIKIIYVAVWNDAAVNIATENMSAGGVGKRKFNFISCPDGGFIQNEKYYVKYIADANL